MGPPGEPGTRLWLPLPQWQCTRTEIDTNPSLAQRADPAGCWLPSYTLLLSSVWSRRRGDLSSEGGKKTNHELGAPQSMASFGSLLLPGNSPLPPPAGSAENGTNSKQWPHPSKGSSPLTPNNTSLFAKHIPCRPGRDQLAGWSYTEGSAAMADRDSQLSSNCLSNPQATTCPQKVARGEK